MGQTSRISLIHNGTIIPAAPNVSVNHSLDLNGLVVEHHSLKRGELPEHTIVDHRLAITIGNRSIPFEYKEKGKWNPLSLHPGSFNMQNHGDIGVPRWLDDYEFLAIAISPDYYRQIIPQISTKSLEFITQRATIDKDIKAFASLFQIELQKNSSSGRLFRDILGIAFATYLLNKYSTGSRKIKEPKGKLHGLQLKKILDFTMSNLDKDMSLNSLSETVYQSPYHFAKVFKRTTGISPHQFVLKLRLEKARHMMRFERLNLTEIAHTIGFFDQSHFTHSFKRFFGVTPRQFRSSL